MAIQCDGMPVVDAINNIITLKKIFDKMFENEL